MPTIKGIFVEEKKNDACKRIAQDIILACENSVRVVESLHSISQYPDLHPNPKILLNEWVKYLFQGDFSKGKKDYRIESGKFSVESVNQLEIIFFNYFLAILPVFFWKKKIEPPSPNNKLKYQWSVDDFICLRNEILFAKYSGDYENAKNYFFDPKNHKKVSSMDTDDVSSPFSVHLKSRIFS